MPIKELESGGRTLPLFEFKLESMAENPSILMIGKRGSGKSYVTRAILEHFHNIPVGIIIAPTDKMNCFFGNFFPDLFIYYKFSSEILENLLKRQEKMIEKEKEKHKNGKKIDAKSFIVMDDCMSDNKNWMKEQTIYELLFNGRHYKIMYILTLQFSLGITPAMRSNFDYIFLLADDFGTNVQRLYTHYAGMFENFHAFKEIFDQVTSNYGCMVVANRGPRSSFQDKIYWYKAPKKDTINQSMGCSQFRYFHKKNYDKNWRNKGSSFDATGFFQRARRDKNSTIKITRLEKDEDGQIRRR
jgi:hypothetical protein